MAIVSIVNGLGNYVYAYSDISLTHPSLNSISDGELVGQTVANRQPNQLIMNDEALRDQMKALELRLHNDYYTKYDLNTSGRSSVHKDNLPNHNNLNGVAGIGPEYLHINQAEKNKYDGYEGELNTLANTIGNLTHNNLSGLQGGGGGNFFHLNQSQLDGLNNLISNGSGGIKGVSAGGTLYGTSTDTYLGFISQYIEGQTVAVDVITLHSVVINGNGVGGAVGGSLIVYF